MHGIMKSISDLGLMVYGIRQRAGCPSAIWPPGLGSASATSPNSETGKPKVLNAQFFAVLEKLGDRADLQGA